MKHSFVPKGVCSKRINFKLVDGLVQDVSFKGGCNGNLKGLSILADL
jgi:uncharacterized protein (TIGR03905 family)